MSEGRYSLTELKATLAGGLIPAVPVMFDREHHFHERGHEAYVSFMSSQPIAGVAVWAHTGRGLLLDDETAQRVMRQWRQAVSKPLIAGVGSRDSNPRAATNATLAMAARAADYGADALLVYPPSWIRHHDQRDSLIVEHHEQLSKLGLPLVLFYFYEAAGGGRYPKTILYRKRKHP